MLVSNTTGLEGLGPRCGMMRQAISGAVGVGHYGAVLFYNIVTKRTSVGQSSLTLSNPH